MCARNSPPRRRRAAARPRVATATFAAVVAAAAVTLAQGCGSRPAPLAGDGSPVLASGAAASDASEVTARPAKGRARLWAENCQRCHNARPATFYTLRQWEIAMHHMRVRAALTAEETRLITEFFRASKQSVE